MSIRNQNWYDLNESRPWPLDDSATLTDSKGKRLPHTLIADLYLRFPETLGDRAILSTVSVTGYLVTVTILGTGSTFSPMATVSIQQPVEPYRHYPLTGMQAGVGGWIVFGKGALTERLTLTFDEPEQAVLLAQTARKYRQLPVYSVGKLHASPALTGLVGLTGGNDIEIVKAEREIEGVVRDVALFRLRDKTTTDQSNNVLELYAGECGRRPASGNCGEPSPIEYVGTVQPDCCGRLFVEFRGAVEVTALSNDAGVILDVATGLDDACFAKSRLPNEDGVLPNEQENQCEDYTDNPDTGGGGGEGEGEEYVFKTKTFEGSPLPYEETFDDYEAADFTYFAGEFVLTEGCPLRGTLSSVVQNVSDPSTCRLLLSQPAVAVPTSVTVSGCSVSAYNVSHTITSANSATDLVSSVDYAGDGLGGTFVENTSGIAGHGAVLESQEARANIALWTEGIPALNTWTSVWKKVEAVVVIKVGATGTKDNGGIVINHRESQTQAGTYDFVLVDIDWSGERAFSISQSRGGAWRTFATKALTDLDEDKRYAIAVTIVPMNEDGGSTTAVLRATLTGLDDGVSAVLGPLPIPDYYPANGKFGLYADRSLTWFDSFKVSDYSP